MSQPPELLRPGEAMVLLGIRHPDTLRKLRRANPEIAVNVAGMKHYRYVRTRVLALRRVRGLEPCKSPPL